MSVLDWLCGTRAARRRLQESRNRLYRMALAWSGDPAQADDLAQEALTRALQKAHQIRDPERIDAWLFSVLHNCWRAQLRRRRPEPLEEEAEERLPAGGPGPEEAGSRDEIGSRVRAAVVGLPAGQRQVVSLVDLEGLSYAEVATTLDIPVGTVMSRLCRARRALKDHLLDLHPAEDEQRPHLRSVQ